MGIWKSIKKTLGLIFGRLRDPKLRQDAVRIAEIVADLLEDAYPILDLVTDVIPGRADDIILDLVHKYALDVKAYVGMTDEERKAAIYAIARRELREKFPYATGDLTDTELNVIIAFALAIVERRKTA